MVRLDSHCLTHCDSKDCAFCSCAMCGNSTTISSHLSVSRFPYKCVYIGDVWILDGVYNWRHVRKMMTIRKCATQRCVAVHGVANYKLRIAKLPAVEKLSHNHEALNLDYYFNAR